LTGTNAEATEDTIVSRIFGLEWGLFNPQFPGEVLDKRNFRTSSQKKLSEDSPCLKDLRGMGLNFDPLPGRIIAGGDHPGLSVF
jgi:hypothetical protein